MDRTRERTPHKLLRPLGGHPMSPGSTEPTLRTVWGATWVTSATSHPGFPDFAAVAGGKFHGLWECNSTPVCWGCQEGSTTYCIPSN